MDEGQFQPLMVSGVPSVDAQRSPRWSLPSSWSEGLTLAWTTLGMLVLLLEPAWRLGRAGLDGFVSVGEPWASWGYLLAVIVMVYVEGYRGFHRAFAPKFAVRAHALALDGTFGERLFAPFAAMGLCACERKTLVRMWTLTLGIVLCIFAVRSAPEPVRSMIDGGVAVALVFGAVSICWHLLQPLPRNSTALQEVGG